MKQGKSSVHQPIYKACYSGSPGRNRCDNADRGSSCINQVCQLCTGNIVLVRNRPHNAADSQTVEIIVDEDQHAECHSGKLCAAAGFDPLTGPASECGRTAGLVHQRYDNAENYQEDQDAYVVGIGENA